MNDLQLHFKSGEPLPKLEFKKYIFKSIAINDILLYDVFKIDLIQFIGNNRSSIPILFKSLKKVNNTLFFENKGKAFDFSRSNHITFEFTPNVEYDFIIIYEIVK